MPGLAARVHLATAAMSLALLAAGAVRAAEVDNCTALDPGIAECGDFSDLGTLEFDLSLLGAANVGLEVQTSAGERSNGTLIFRAFLFNDSYLVEGEEIDFAQVELQLSGGARFETIGTVRNFDFEPVTVMSPEAELARLSPAPPLPPTDLLEIGALDPEVPGAVDWEIDISQLAATGFVLRIVAVPEPGVLASRAGAALVLGMLAARAARRRR
ncbi:hypothetical protein KJ059_06840 [Myxococcota bacterium]|nr:hypothetical protein [Myxococcota bacterium]MCZ7620250.1 hypothetical protein [Myxococcota bacterium]